MLQRFGVNQLVGVFLRVSAGVGVESGHDANKLMRASVSEYVAGSDCVIVVVHCVSSLGLFIVSVRCWWLLLSLSGGRD